MRFKFTISLLILNLIVFSCIFFLKKKSASPFLENDYGFLAVPLSDISKIEISGADIPVTKTLVKQNNQWLITSPIHWPANLFAVQRILTQLQFLKPEISFPLQDIQRSGQSLADYGFDAPNMAIHLYNTHQKISTLFIGNPTSVGKNIYILSSSQTPAPTKTDTGTISVIKQSLIDSLSMDLENLRNQQIFNIPLFELTSLNIQILSPHNLKIRLTKNNNQWLFETPIQTPANSSLVDNAIHQLFALNIKKFIPIEDHSTTHHGLLSPSMRVTLADETHRQTLLIGNPDTSDPSKETYFAQLEGNPTIFTISPQFLFALKDAQDALREKRFLTFSPENLTGITITTTGHSIPLQKTENNDWQLLSKDSSGNISPIEADSALIANIINVLSNLEATAFITDAPSSNDLQNLGLLNPAATITLHDESPHSLLISKPEPSLDTLYAKLDSSPSVYQIHPSILHLIPTHSLDYYQKSIPQLPKNAIITSIKFTDLSSTSTFLDYSLPNPTDSWDTVLAPLPEFKKNSLSSLIDSLPIIEANSILQTSFSEEGVPSGGSTIPWDTLLEITFSSQDLSSPKSLQIFLTSRLSGSQQFAGLPAKNLTINLNQNWIDYLFSLSQTSTP